LTSLLVMHHRHTTALALALTSLTLAACGSDDETVATTAPAPVVTEPAGSGAAPAEADMLAVATTYADLVTASYDASIASATELKTAIDAFVADPTDATLKAAKDQWLASRDDYGPTEAFRLYDGPIDAPETGPEGQINAWPLDEAYIDYVKDDPAAGIINNVTDFPEITVDVLTGANEQGGEANISTGWHAIEFLLWGQDFDPEGPGARPVTDYTTAENADRRGEYLTLLAQLLIDDLNFVNDQWKPDTGAYRTEFLADPKGAITKMFRGIGALSSGELAGERMNVAFETKDQEDEHSCFSDNTDADIRNNASGIRMVYLADGAGVTGPSLSSLVAAVDPALDTKIKTELDTSVELASNFPATFEKMIQADSSDPINQAFLAAIESIEGQGDDLAAAAAALGISISIEV
jgi:putative iron-regulated protein